MKKGAVIRESRRVWWGTIDATFTVIEYQPTPSSASKERQVESERPVVCSSREQGTQLKSPSLANTKVAHCFGFSDMSVDHSCRGTSGATMGTIKQLLEEESSA